MSAYRPITKNGVDAAAPLDMNETRSEKDISVCIEFAPDGLHIRCDYLGKASGIVAAVEKLKAMGLQELVTRAQPAAAPAPPTNGHAAIVRYDDAGDAYCCNPNCTRNGKPHAPSMHGTGTYCPGKDSLTGNDKGYCKGRT